MTATPVGRPPLPLSPPGLPAHRPGNPQGPRSRRGRSPARPRATPWPPTPQSDSNPGRASPPPSEPSGAYPPPHPRGCPPGRASPPPSDLRILGYPLGGGLGAGARLSLGPGRPGGPRGGIRPRVHPRTVFNNSPIRDTFALSRARAGTGFSRILEISGILLYPPDPYQNPVRILPKPSKTSKTTDPGFLVFSRISRPRALPPAPRLYHNTTENPNTL